MKFLRILVLLTAMTPILARAQFCGTERVMKKMRDANPALDRKLRDADASWTQYARTRNGSAQSFVQVSPRNDTTYEMPVVVHVLYTSADPRYNVSDADVRDMIDYFNQAFAGTWASYPDTNNGGTHIPIRFTLAKRDPNCNATNGIDHVDLSANSSYVQGGVNYSNSSGLSDEELKATCRWPVNDYYNVYIVNKIDGIDGYPGSTTSSFIAGYALYPPADPLADGIIMLSSQAHSGNSVLTHEFGHAFGLRHVFEGGSAFSCPSEFDCTTDGDLVCDTEPQMQSQFDCPSGINPCTGAAWAGGSHNFMDYSNCKDRFTPGQRERMLFMLRNYRIGLASSLGSVAPDNNTAPVACVPTGTQNGNTGGPEAVRIGNMTAFSEDYKDGNGQHLFYKDRSCAYKATLTLGSPTQIDVHTNSNELETAAIYLDLNRDGDFSDAGETLYTGMGGYYGAIYSYTYNVPTTGIQTCVPYRMRIATDIDINGQAAPACGVYLTGRAEDYTVIFKPEHSDLVVTNAQTGGPTGPSCAGTQLTYTATVPYANNPQYRWFVNGVNTGVTTSTFSSSSLQNGDAVRAQVFDANTCSTDSFYSNILNVQRAPAAPYVSVSRNITRALCPGESATFTAYSIGAGTPTYTWYVNGIAVQSGSSDTYTSPFSDQDQVQAIVTSSYTCQSPNTASSNATIVTVNAQQALGLSYYVSNAITCSNTSAYLTCNSTVTNAQFTWTDQSGGTYYGDYVYAYTPGLFTLTASASASCSYTDTVRVQADTVHPALASGVRYQLACDTPYARAGTRVIFGTNDYSYYWTGPSIVSSAYSDSILADRAGTYTVTVYQYGNGCYTTDAVEVTGDATGLNTSVTQAGLSLTAEADNASYQWIDCDHGFSPVPGAVGKRFFAPRGGHYAVIVSKSSCVDTSACYEIQSTTEVAAQGMETIEAYPNPATDHIYLRGLTKPATIRIYSALGNLVAEQKTDRPETGIRIGSVAEGMYLLRVTTEDGAWSKQIVVQRN